MIVSPGEASDISRAAMLMPSSIDVDFTDDSILADVNSDAKLDLAIGDDPALCPGGCERVSPARIERHRPVPRTRSSAIAEALDEAAPVVGDNRAVNR